MRPWCSERARGLPLIPWASADAPPRGPAPVFLQNLVGSSGGLLSRPHMVTRSMLPWPTPALGTSHFLPQSQALSAWANSWSQSKGQEEGGGKGEGGEGQRKATSLLEPNLRGYLQVGK